MIGVSKSILLIGHSGYIGSRLEVKLRQDGHIVDTCSRCTRGMIQNTYNCSYSLLTETALEIYDVIILLAGLPSVASCKSLIYTHNQNVENFVNLLAKIKPYQRFIYASSASVTNGIIDAKESDPLHPPINYYDASKQAIDLFSQTTKVNYYGLRFGTVCGRSSNQRMDLIVNRMAWYAVNTGKIEVFNGQSYRSILSLRDLVCAVSTIVRSTKDAPGIYNLASTSGQIIDIANAIGNYYTFIQDMEVKIVDKGGNDNKYRFTLNASKFERTFGYFRTDTINSILEELPLDYLQSIKDLKQYERV